MKYGARRAREDIEIDRRIYDTLMESNRGVSLFDRGQ